ncbi:UDP-N-acetylmuramoyl-tripeptide--D-alanyl-D-alanine ligase [Siminovitchia sp. FSL W7-1587]|uniref:UDP-N-acetylmuramoyl-tripeptide--D-alanyl-D- alanine ligase n=1 Tax=Siminovitchia sp. FSL W7-1587 TaxID=2954699 RepID=UPI0030D148A1
MAAGFTYQEIADILDGYFFNELEQSSPIVDFEFDPAQLQKGVSGNCFISISRERWNQFHKKELPWIDGNVRILEYYKNCDLIITEEPIKELAPFVAQIIVKNSIKSMQILAKQARNKMKNPVIGITGSVGKSSTRLILEHLLKEISNVVATRGNHNTQTGVPLYGAKLCRNPDMGIVEISLNALNNRGNQALTIRPDVCMVTSIGEAHLSTLHSTMNVATFKARIFDGLTTGGLAIINKDIGKEEFRILYEQAKKRTNRIKTYSLIDKSADLFLKKRIYEKYKTTVIFQYKKTAYTFDMIMPSDGIMMNTLGALLCLAELGYDIDSMARKVYDFKSLDRVMELKRLNSKDQRRIDIIDDSHNAAIPSMINAIKTFKEKQFFYKGKKILVLGQVADLGDQSEYLHDKLVPYILQSDADYVFGHGKYMRDVIKKLPANMVGGWFNNALELSTRIPYYCSDDSFILLKGSVSGSDFRKTSHYLPAQIKRSTKEIKDITPQPQVLVDHIQPMWGIVGYDLKENKEIFHKGYLQTKSIEGIGPIILLLLLFQMGIQDQKVSRLNRWPTNEGVSINQKPFHFGQTFTHRELAEEVMLTQHPSAVFELAHLYFSNRNKAMKEITKLVEMLDITPSAALNLTGRYRVKEQQSFQLSDLIKVGKALKQYQSELPIIMNCNGMNMRGIAFGTLRSHCILFIEDVLYCGSGMTSVEDLKRNLTFSMELTRMKS